MLEYFINYKYFFVFAAIFMVLWWAWDFNCMRRKRHRFDGRDDLPIDQIYERYFANIIEKEFFKKLWTEAGKALFLYPGKLRPDDRFDKELEEANQVDDSLFCLQVITENRLKKMGIKMSAADWKNIKTLRDYISIFAKIAEK